jgi:hypothetical protein
VRQPVVCIRRPVMGPSTRRYNVRSHANIARMVQWNADFGLSDVSRLLDGAPLPWWVAGGWALDLYLETANRPRKDIDIAILRRDQSRLRSHLSGWELSVAVPERGLVAWSADLPLDPPLHALWGKPAGDELWACEFLLNDASEAEWVYRRDSRVTYPLAALLTSTAAGIPFLPPEIVLLYKSKNPRPGDETDFQATRPHLAASAIAWLSSALMLIDSRHPWIQDLARPPTS